MKIISLFFTSLIVLTVACSTSQQIAIKNVRKNNSFKIAQTFVDRMTLAACTPVVAEFRTHLRSIDLQKNIFDEDAQNDFFSLRLQIKDKFIDLAEQGTVDCARDVKGALSDLRALEETIGYNARLQNQKTITGNVSVQHVFTDSHIQLMNNPYINYQVTALTDLKTGDLLLMHRETADSVVVAGSTPVSAEWTEIAVVIKGSDERLYMLEMNGQRIKQISLTSSEGWIKRGVVRTQVLRPKAAMAYDKMLSRWIGVRLKDSFSFGDYIKKEYRLRSSSSALIGHGDAVLASDLELSPDMEIVSEWKDYKAAYRSRVLGVLLRSLSPEQVAFNRSERQAIVENTLRGSDALISHILALHGLQKPFKSFHQYEKVVFEYLVKIEKTAHKKCKEWSHTGMVSHLIDLNEPLCVNPAPSESNYTKDDKITRGVSSH
jgi:hypothetical protein